MSSQSGDHDSTTHSLLEPVVHMAQIGEPVQLVSAPAKLFLRRHVTPLDGWCQLTAHWDGRGLRGTFVGPSPGDEDVPGGAGDLVPETVEITDDWLGTARFAVAPGVQVDLQPTLFEDVQLEATFRLRLSRPRRGRLPSGGGGGRDGVLRSVSWSQWAAVRGVVPPAAS